MNSTRKTSNFFGEKTLNFMYNLSLLSRGAVGFLFSDHLEKHILVFDGYYWVQMLGRHLEMGAKKSEASDAFSTFFRLNDVTFFLMFVVCFIKFFMFDKSFCTQSA